ncbi:hypothetical protein, partial [Escherichia coli]|uniref:hypothetical protein n=1 Tax=Escherichia coli TaxID=562 RepID=UPI001BC89794
MALDPKIRINLERSVVLLVEHNTQALEALTSMFRGFGVRKQFKCSSTWTCSRERPGPWRSTPRSGSIWSDPSSCWWST